MMTEFEILDLPPGLKPFHAPKGDYLIEEGILSAIGNTPLVRLSRITGESNIRLYAKLEALNPGGSMKDRPALNIIRHSIEAGDIRPDTIVIESSSGNMGVGLAQVCSYLGLRFICVVDKKTTDQNLRLLKAYGADVEVVTEPDPITNEYLKARIDRVKDLLSKNENSFWPNQYGNFHNPASHHQTMHEIVTALDDEVDYIFCATSTCGTLRGCAEYLTLHNLRTKIYAVDAKGSVIFGGQKAKRLIPGHGAAVRPDLFRHDLADKFIQVSDLDCVVGCRRLAREEAILCGGSSGALISAFEQVKESLPSGASCVLVLPDRGERYLDTIYSDSWVSEHFGDVSYLWESAAEVAYA
ncbi:MAG: 2,3-diaminopropionate biosynthesis protein SbnA [Pyrinomonadaceae bacterium]|nr:2,3-diaminopropionate biosynthesis protein SbnA [Pyrinomonadaceae bacterium]